MEDPVSVDAWAPRCRVGLCLIAAGLLTTGLVALSTVGPPLVGPGHGPDDDRGPKLPCPEPGCGESVSPRSKDNYVCPRCGRKFTSAEGKRQ